MRIRPFLAGQAFEPEIIDQMSAAFVRACEALQARSDELIIRVRGAPHL